MNTAENFIKDHIQKHGPIDLANYMTLALSHPTHGYYMQRDPFGTDGDFTTAPEISQMFGELLGAWTADIFFNGLNSQPLDLLELGPGRGTLMADALRSTKNIPNFHKALDLHLLEMSPTLKEKQKEALKNQKNTNHYKDITSFKSNKPLIIIANEFLDALPVHHLEFDGTNWQERTIELSSNGTLKWGLQSACPALLKLIPSIPVSPKTSDIIEISPERTAFMHTIFNALKKNGGIALFIDYGYTKPHYGETLQALHKHKYCDVFDNIGNADLTAHVDFSALENLASECGIECYGTIEQGTFLKHLGIETRAQTLMKNATNTQRTDIEKALHRLTNSGEMGTLFKAIGFGYGLQYRPAGF